MKSNENYKNFEDLPLAMTVEEAAGVLKIGRSLAYEMVRSGKLKSLRIGRKIRISRTALADFLECTN